MPGKSLSPELLGEAVTLRAAGFTVAAIAQRTGVSVRTLNRAFQRHGTKKGELKDDLVESARRSLLDGFNSDERIKAEAARIVADDLAHARLLRERMAEAAEHLAASDLRGAALLMRAAAAYSTALKNTSDMLRRTLRIDRVVERVESEDLPTLTVREITDELAAARHAASLEYDQDSSCEAESRLVCKQDAAL